MPIASSPASSSATSAVLSEPTTSPPMMSMQPSGSTRSAWGRSQRKRQKACTQGDSAASGARSSYCRPSPPRKIARGRAGSIIAIAVTRPESRYPNSPDVRFLQVRPAISL